MTGVPTDLATTWWQTDASDPEEGFCSRQLSPWDRPSHLEILLPPAAILIVAFTGLTTLIFVDRWRSRRNPILASLCKPYQRHLVNQREPNERHLVNEWSPDNKPPRRGMQVMLADPTFFSEFDLEVLKDFERFYNKPGALAKLCLPALASLMLTTAGMFLYNPMAECLWPVSGRPDINTAVTCFLAPAGLVYALSFGFVFQQTLERQKAILDRVTNEVSLMDQMVTMANKLRLPSRRHQMAMYKAIKSELIFTCLLIQNREPSNFKTRPPTPIKVDIWAVLDILRDAADHPEYAFNMNAILVEKMIGYLIQLNNICFDRMGALHTSIHPLKWVFLAVLSSLTLFGVMLIDAFSRKMEVAMCELTIFSVTMLFFVLADLDSPFNGFFRVDTSVLPEVVKKLDGLYQFASLEEQVVTKNECGRVLKPAYHCDITADGENMTKVNVNQ